MINKNICLIHHIDLIVVISPAIPILPPPAQLSPANTTVGRALSTAVLTDFLTALLQDGKDLLQFLLVFDIITFTLFNFCSGKNMIPIYEQGKGNGIGHSSESFKMKFDELCQDHLQNGRAKAFAFIFYDFNDYEFRSVLKNQGVFVQLDRLAGTDLSIFYLHSGGRNAVARFNREFLKRLGIGGDIPLPCIVFFRLIERQIGDVGVVQLESADLIHGFYELYDVIEKYIKEALDHHPKDSKYIRWLKSSAKFISIETFRDLLESFIKIAIGQ